MSYMNTLKSNIKYSSSKLVGELTRKNLKIATAESCTGGLLSKYITDVPGSSLVFECGICSYSNHIKEKILGVKAETLKKYTAVSAQVAKEMAHGVRILAKSDIAISTTGYAGPKSSNPNEKVGLVFICIESENLSKIIKLDLHRNINNEREYIRNMTVNKAIIHLMNILANNI